MRSKTVNIIMVCVIVVMMAGGIIAALALRSGNEMNSLGKTFYVSPEEISADDVNVCTIEIRCDTILKSIEKLNEAKIPYVPENGILLEKTKVVFQEEETVFDILCQICEKVDIQLEYSWTPVYDNYYIEGINHLYEFDCGSQSGWMYQVNGQFPNYGCSSYMVQPEDEIVWIYTCEGLGMDVGAKLEE